MLCKQAELVECNRYYIQKDLGLNPGCVIWAIYLTSLSFIFLICNVHLKGLWELKEMKGCMSPYQGVAGIVLSLKKLPITIIINVLDEMKSQVSETFFFKETPWRKSIWHLPLICVGVLFPQRNFF